MGLSWPHILIALLVFALLFGTGKISALMGDVAKGIKSFKKGMSEDEETVKKDDPFKKDDPKSIEASAAKPVQTAAAETKKAG